MNKKIKITMTALTISTVLLNGCSKKEAESVAEKENIISSNAIWIAYWDQEEALEQLETIDVQNICLFGAYFNEDDEIIVAEKTKELKEELSFQESYTTYLTVVNDIVSQENGNTQKDTTLIASLLKTEESTKKHIEDLLTVTQELGFDGIEIDYENIRKDESLWPVFISFLEQLQTEANLRNIQVRVVLEPGTSVEGLSFPDGIDYVVMCYNLYGNGTTPGPKADKEFLLKVKQRFSSLPNVSFALANGGYEWDEENAASSLTTVQAITLAIEHEKTPKRDEDSGALSFAYEKDGKTYTVWYGDATTLETWAAVLNEDESVPVSIWRMNG